VSDIELGPMAEDMMEVAAVEEPVAAAAAITGSALRNAASLSTTDRPPAVQSSDGGGGVGFLAMSPGDRSRRAAGRHTTGPPATSTHARRRLSLVRWWGCVSVSM